MKQSIENEISYNIRGAIFKVYNAFGPRLLESVYTSALAVELFKQGHRVLTEVPITVTYEGEKLGIGFRIDLLIDDLVIIEVKSVENIADVHHKQLITYLKLTGKKLGILVNFNVSEIQSGIYRKVNNF